MKVTIDQNRIIREWPRVEKYYNTTLRYAAPKEFPNYLVSQLGKGKLIRCFVTLDEIWDCRSDEYNWDYIICGNPYTGEPEHYYYDWGVCIPNGVHFNDYLTSHALISEEVLLNVRRYEREVTDGKLSFDKYSEVCERTIEHCKALCPNITYIECCNEVQLASFGAITTDEYYKIYQCMYKVLRKLNRKHNYDKPLRLGGVSLAGFSRFSDWYRFLELLAADKDEEKMIDFYSAHNYNRDIYRMADFYIRHNEAVHRLGLPDSPLFFNEIGACSATGENKDNLENASYNISYLILGSRMENVSVWPWCSFHNPKLQMSYTQYLQLEDGSFVPTPNGNAMFAMTKLFDYELEIKDYVLNKAVATTDGFGHIAVLVTNPTNEPDEIVVTIPCYKEIYKVNYEEYLCDSTHNNHLTDSAVTAFTPTASGEGRLAAGTLTFKKTLEPNAFCLWIIGN